MNPIQQNNNNKKDKIDKTPEETGEQIKEKRKSQYEKYIDVVSDNVLYDDVEELDLSKEKDDYER